MNTKAIVNSLLEGEDISELLKNNDDINFIGKKIANCSCPSCNESDTLVVDSVLEEDQGFYKVLSKCSNCSNVAELEIVLKNEVEPEVNEGTLDFDGKIFYPITEGLMNGNYLKFNSNIKGFIIKDENGNNLIVFDEPEGDSKPLNTRVTFKVISFRNGLAKLVSMVNDKFNNDKAGTLYFADKNFLQKFAKTSTPRLNSTMAGKYA